ncbi:uncharacterized protein LOC144115640 isoform X3 [Amblyomma americanum]
MTAQRVTILIAMAKVFVQIITFAFLPVWAARPPGIVPDIRTPHQEGELCARHLVATDTWEPLETPPLENWTKQAASAAPSSPTAPFASATKQRQPPSAHCGLCGCATARTANPLIFVMQEPYQTTGRWGGSSRPTNQVLLGLLGNTGGNPSPIDGYACRVTSAIPLQHLPDCSTRGI